MMNTRLTEDIMARLNKGEDIEAIAREFTESINSANEQYRLAEKAKRAEETRWAPHDVERMIEYGFS